MLSTPSFHPLREATSLARVEAAQADDPLDRSGSPMRPARAAAASASRYS
jgi:hypothetical protein